MSRRERALERRDDPKRCGVALPALLSDWSCSLDADHFGDHIAYEYHEIGGRAVKTFPRDE